MARDIDDMFDDETTVPREEIVLAGRYRIVREIGRGAQGPVYLAEDLNLGNRPVAIKMPPAVLARNKKAVAALRAEAEMAMRLSDPNIVTLRTFESTEEGVFLVMDFVEGRTLEDLLADEGPFDEERLQQVILPVARALDHAHEERVIHRDVKPSNIMIREDGRPLLTDFGIAREMKDTMTRVTGKGTSGTLPYMSPEQLRGDPPSAAQDVYSLAATMYECLAGHAPFHRGEIAHQIETKVPESPTQRRTPLVRAILRGLSKNPASRPASCGELLCRTPEVSPVSAPPILPWIVAGAGIFLAIVIVLVVLTGRVFRKGPTEEDRITTARSDGRPTPPDPRTARSAPLEEPETETAPPDERTAPRVEASPREDTPAATARPADVAPPPAATDGDAAAGDAASAEAEATRKMFRAMARTMRERSRQMLADLANPTEESIRASDERVRRDAGRISSALGLTSPRSARVEQALLDADRRSRDQLRAAISAKKIDSITYADLKPVLDRSFEDRDRSMETILTPKEMETFRAQEAQGRRMAEMGLRVVCPETPARDEERDIR